MRVITKILIFCQFSFGMLIDDLQFQCKILEFNETIGMDRNFVVKRYGRWVNGEVPYVYEKDLLESEKILIRKVMDYIQSKSCVKFKAREGEFSYLSITAVNEGCSSHIGYEREIRKHLVNLNRTGCMAFPVVLHELSHALGFDHEQNRPDRDKHVKIHWKNILKDQLHNFFKNQPLDGKSGPYIKCSETLKLKYLKKCYSERKINTFGVGYDYNSIMHYSAFAFSKTRRKTISSLDPTVHIGPGRFYTTKDILKLNRAYPCDEMAKVCEDEMSGCQSISHICNTNIFFKRCKKRCNHCN